MNAISNLSSISPSIGRTPDASLDVARNAQAPDLKTDYSTSILTSGRSPFLPENAAELQGSSDAQASAPASRANRAANDSAGDVSTSGNASKGGDVLANLKSMFNNVIKAVTSTVSSVAQLVTKGVGAATKLLG